MRSDQIQTGVTACEAIATVDSDGTILFASRSIEQLFGYPVIELVGRNLIDFVPNKVRRRHSTRLKRYLTDGKKSSGVLDLPIQHKDGHQIQTGTSLTGYDLENRRVFIAIIRDISGQGAPDAIHERFQEYQNLFRLANDSIMIIEPVTEIILDVNDRACDEYGFSREEFLGSCLKDHTQDVSRGELLMNELIITGNCRAYESIHFRSDGSPIVFLINASLVAYEGRPAILTNNRDITEQKKISDELKRNLSLLTSTFEATADGILAVDLENKIVASNEKFLEMWNVPEKLRDVSTYSVQIAAHVMAMVKDPGKLRALMDRSIDEPDEVSVDELELVNGRIIERCTQPQKFDGQTVGRVMSFQDVTKQKEAEQTLRESESRYRLLFDRNPYPIWVFDAETLKFLAVNDAASQKYGYSPEEFLEKSIKDVTREEDVPILSELAADQANEDSLRSARHRRKDGTIIDVEVAAQSITYSGRRARLELVTDVTERKQAEAALKQSEGRLRTLLDSMSEGLLQVDSSDRILYTNNCICEMTGYSQEELMGTHWAKLLADKGSDFVNAINVRREKGLSDRYEIRIRKKSGEIIWVSVGGAPVSDVYGNIVGSMGVFTDITDRKSAEERLLHDAMHDGLTGLANRSLFMEHLRVMLKRSRNRKSIPFAVLYLDFDRFKVINDSLGHAEGDKLLKFIARRLESCVRPGDLIARLGGDEFVILLSEITDTAEALLVAERIQNDLKTAFDLGGREIYTTTSIGITLSTSGYVSADDMLRDADIAMYCAKSRGKAQYQIFDRAMLKHASKKLQIETEMRGALQRGEFKVLYQPILRLDTGGLIGFEALLRWVHPTRGPISPDEFIPIAEENGLIMKLGQLVVEKSCRQLREWQLKVPGAETLTISVNLSSKEFLQLDLAEKISANLKEAELDPRFLKLEITESHLMANSELAETILHRLQDLGVEMSLDDFGTGYSSLSYLHRLPVKFLKIDRSFIGRMGGSDESREIVLTIIRLAQNLKMKVVAEGIETMEQLTELAEMGCEYGQGYLFAPPLETDAAKQFIREHTTSTAIALVIPAEDHTKLLM